MKYFNLLIALLMVVGASWASTASLFMTSETMTSSCTVVGEIQRVKLWSTSKRKTYALRFQASQQKPEAKWDIACPELKQGDRLFFCAMLHAPNDSDSNSKKLFANINGATSDEWHIEGSEQAPVSIELTAYSGKSVRLSLYAVFSTAKEKNVLTLTEPAVYWLKGNGQDAIEPPSAGIIVAGKANTAFSGFPELEGIKFKRTDKQTAFKAEFLSSKLDSSGSIDFAHYPFEPQLKLASVSTDKAVVSASDVFEMRASVVNIGEGYYHGAGVRLSCTVLKGLALLDGGERVIERLAPGETALVRWKMRATERTNVNSAIVHLKGIWEGMLAAPASVVSRHNFPTKTGLFADSSGSYGLIQNERIRVVAQPSSTGTALRIFTNEGSAWKELIESASLLTIIGNGLSAPARRTPFRAENTTAAVVGSAGIIKMRGKAGSLWQGDIEIIVRQGSSNIQLKAVVSSCFSADLSALIFPDIKVSASEKEVALNPGALWLDSQSHYDSLIDGMINPLSLTLPILLVQTSGGTVGLSWDPNQEWMPGWRAPRPLFATPNTSQMQDNQRMALWLPGGTNDETGFPAMNSAYIAGGQAITQSAEILCLPAKTDIEDALRWYIRNKPLPNPSLTERTGAGAIEFLTQGVLACWNPEQRIWQVSADANSKPDEFSALALIGAVSVVTANQTQNAQAQNQMNSFWEHKSEASITTAYYLGNIIETLRRVEDEIKTYNNVRWNNRPLCEIAKACNKVWEAARLFDNADAVKLGESLLRHLELSPTSAYLTLNDSNPSKLALTADCINAFYSAYLKTGSNEYLLGARRWASAGLACIYFWNVYNRPAMRYASISGVEGAAEYAYALQRMAASDGSAPWKKVAEGIIGWLLQITEFSAKEKPSSVGLMPSGYDIMQNKTDGAINVNPSMLMLNIMALSGLDLSIKTAKSGGITLSSAGEILSFKLNGSILEATIRAAIPCSSFVIVSSIAKPLAVQIGDEQIEQVEDIETTTKGWIYLAEKRMAIIKIPSNGALTTLKIGY